MNRSGKALEAARNEYERWGDVGMEQDPPALTNYISALEEALAEATAIAVERRRQIEQEGWAPEHDDQHAQGEMAAAAACYAMACLPHLDIAAWCWPWDKSWWKPTDRRRNLVKAGALIAAEIDRLDRAARESGDVR